MTYPSDAVHEVFFGWLFKLLCEILWINNTIIQILQTAAGFWYISVDMHMELRWYGV